MLCDEKSLLEKLIKSSTSDIQFKIQNLYSDEPEEIKKLITPIAVSDNDYINRWSRQSYIRKPVSDDIPIFKTNRGEIVRSKSELNIANVLDRMNIPYKYECPLTLSGGIIIYPDFTILDCIRRKIIYWEHRGMMDDREYAKHSVSRLRSYENNDIFLGDNLIITEETSSAPLGTDEIIKIIKHYLKSEQ